jgi:hypothetical protein
MVRSLFYACANVKDWQHFKLRVSVIPDEVLDRVEVMFESGAEADPASPLGLPLYRPATADSAPAVEVGGISAPSGGLVGLSSSYIR